MSQTAFRASLIGLIALATLAGCADLDEVAQTIVPVATQSG